MGKKSGNSTQATTTTQKADPWSGVQPSLTSLYANAGQWFNSGAPMAAPINTNMQQAVNMTRAQAVGGNPLLPEAVRTTRALASGNYGTPVMTGQMLNDNPWAQGAGVSDDPTAMGMYLDKSNPYLDAMVNAASRNTTSNFMNSIAPALASQFSAAGRTGSGAHVAAFGTATDKLGQELGDINTNIRGQTYQFERGLMNQQYEAERQRQAAAYEAERSGQRQSWMQQPSIQLAAAGLAPQLTSAGYIDAQALMGAGQTEHDTYQATLGDPAQRLQTYASILAGAAPYGTSSSSNNQTVNQPRNVVSSAFGGGLLGSMIPGLGPAGIVGGALLGGLFG